MISAVRLAAIPLVVAFFTFGLTGTSHGHTVFKKFLQSKYKNLQIKCEGCHIKGKPKTDRNPFGELFHQQLKDQNLTQQWESLKGEEKRAFEKETMTPAFEKALAAVKELKNDQNQAYGDLIASGAIQNMGLKKGDDDDEGEDDEDDDDDGGKESQPVAVNESSYRRVLFRA